MWDDVIVFEYLVTRFTVSGGTASVPHYSAAKADFPLFRRCQRGVKAFTRTADFIRDDSLSALKPLPMTLLN